MSSSTAKQPSILLVGLPLTYSLIPDKIRPMLMQQGEEIERRIRAMKIKFEWPTYVPEDDLTPFANHLTAHPWDAIIIGYGVRGNPDLTYFMEQLINVIRTNTPATTKILFNTDILTTIDAIKRWFPQVKEE